MRLRCSLRELGNVLLGVSLGLILWMLIMQNVRIHKLEQKVSLLIEITTKESR